MTKKSFATQDKTVMGSLIGLVVFGIIALNALFVVDETEKAFVLQFGELKHVYDKPGLKAKIPFIQEVVYYDRRLLDYNLLPLEVTAGDQKRLVIDIFTRYVIENPVLFYRTVRNEIGASNRLSSIVDGSMRHVVGKIPLSNLLSKERSAIMGRIHEEVRKAAKSFGIDVRGVRIIRADLPKENSESIFRRMQSERRQEVNRFIAEGNKKSYEIKATADRRKKEIIAKARKEAEIIKGTADAQAAQIYAAAHGQNLAFYEIYRSLKAYPETFGDDTTFVLSPESSEFFKYFEHMNGH